MLYCVAAVALCVRIRGGGGGGGVGGEAGANLNTVKRIVSYFTLKSNLEYCEENSYFTLKSNQSQMHNNLSEKCKYSNEPKNTLYFLF